MRHQATPAQYEDIRPTLKTGDLVFFGGHDGFVSAAIRFLTASPYSHVAIVLRSYEGRVVLMESTTLLEGKRGVQRTLLSERIDRYRGLVDVATLSDSARMLLNASICASFLERCEGKPYDTGGALLSGLGQWLRIPGRQRLDSLYCSELADAAHVAGGLIVGRDRTPTPEEMAERPIFAEFYRVRDVNGSA